MKFKKLENGKISEVEKKYSDYWEKEKVFEKSIKQRKDNYVFYDGPATANGMPGIHHMMAKLLKDTITKYKAMQGYRVVRKVGWDTHGLPVEVQVEKNSIKNVEKVFGKMKNTLQNSQKRWDNSLI